MLQRIDGSTIAACPVPELLDASVAEFGNRPALSFLGRKWSYAALGALVDQVAAGLQAHGVEKGTKVGLCLPNTPYSVIFFFAVMKAGGTVVNFSPLYVERELSHQIRDSGTTIMVVPDLRIIHSRVAAVAREAGLKTIVVCPMSGVLPLFHVFAMTTVMNIPIALGAEIILVPRFQLTDLLKTIARTRPTLFPGVPTIYGAINNAPETQPQDLASLKLCISGGAPLPVEVRHRFEALTGCKLVEGYGLSETSPVLTANPPTGIIKDGSVGKAVPQTVLEIRSLEDPTRILGVGEKGEVCARGPQVMLGYWNRPEETRSAFVDGAFRTGDVGYVDADGYLFLVDRIKDVILCGGFNVYPRMIEEALYLHPAVAEAVVIGVPDPYRGQAPKAFVTLKAGETVTGDDLRAFLIKQVSKVEMPKEVEVRDSLPRTLVGKLSKKELVDEERQRHPQG